MHHFENLYTKEDLEHDALIYSASKGVPLEKARYFARMKGGRESLPLARGFEPFIDLQPDHSNSLGTPDEPSILYLAILEEIQSRNLQTEIKRYVSNHS